MAKKRRDYARAAISEMKQAQDKHDKKAHELSAAQKLIAEIAKKLDTTPDKIVAKIGDLQAALAKAQAEKAAAAA